jgi:peptide-methionine (S)-S-oxide reductase
MTRSDLSSPSRRLPIYLMAGLAAAALLAFGPGRGLGRAEAAEAAVILPLPTVDEPPAPGRHTETAVFAGGCFWGVQGVFQHVKGVTNAVSGYSGGKADTAHYEMVGTGATGHAESVEVTFDPAQVSYGRLLQVFFSVAHNPTQLNYQGPDHGSQYRSALFPTDDGQRKVAEAYVAQLGAAKVFKAPIVTRIEPYHGFYPAEGYHQNFLTLNPDYGYIVVNDLPKIRELERLFPALYSPKPVLVPDAVAAR